MSPQLDSVGAAPAAPHPPEPLTRDLQPASSITKDFQPATSIPRDLQPASSIPRDLQPASPITTDPQPSASISRYPQPVSTITRYPQPVPSILRDPQPVSTITRDPQPVPSIPRDPQPAASIPRDPQTVPSIPRDPQPISPEKHPQQAVTLNRKKMKSLAQRRQSAPSLVLSKALNKSRTITKESCFSPVSPETCPLVQTFICPSRAFIMHSPVQLKTGLQTQDRHLFLFTDIMIVAKSKSPTHYKLKHHVRVSEMWTASCMEEVCEGSTSPERSFVLGWPITNCVATFGTPEEKEKWLALIQRHIKEEKESDHPKTIPLKIITKDIGNCAYSKILTVTTEDTVTDVVKMSLQQFGVEGSHTDYQLWVTSGKDDSPYPLIGHEYPYAIKMSHIRDAMPHIQGTKDAVCPLNLDLPFLMEQLPREMQCQFILKPSRLALCHQLAEPNQKPFKRKRSIINWTFWRGSNTQLDNIPLSPTSPAPGKLFGLSLTAICENDNLPKPIMDMLSVLCQEGPFTRGIFRRSANAKSCKEMKERLNSGCDVNFACESIFVTASVFKDFLRNIPGSIFSSRLYDKWVSVMDQGNEHEKIKSIKKLLEKLPRVNVMLLRYLFGVLHCIEQRSEINQMTPFNLAVCIAPSLLWLPSPASAEAEGEFTRKVSMLVQFLIENCNLTFGEDISLLYANLSDKDNREDSSDICSFKHIDSSYDSLENGLNDVDSPFGGLTKKLSHDNRSRDSVLTLSDCDLDHPDVEENQGEDSKRSPPVSMLRAFHHKPASCGQSEGESHCSSSSAFSSAMLSDGRRYRRSSEPAIGILVSQFSQLNEPSDENAAHNTSCDALLSQSADDYLKQHRYLQVEGQKLIDRSVTLGIDVTKNIGKKQRPEKKNSPDRLLPSTALRLNICSRTSCSSLSSPGTSPSGSSLSSLDSAFSQFSDYSVLTPNEVTSPLDCTIRSHKKQIELTPDYVSANSFSGFILDENSKPSCYSHFAGKDSIERSCYASHVNAQPGTWLRKSSAVGKCTSSRRTEANAPRYEENKRPATQEQQSNVSNISKITMIQDPLTVPKADCETEYPITENNPYVQQGDIQISSSPSVTEELGGRRHLPRHLATDGNVDRNGNGEGEVECSSFRLPSPVSINIEISSHSTAPQTFFFGDSIVLHSQSNRRKSTNSFTVEESQSLSSSRSSSEISRDDEIQHRKKDNATRTTIGREISLRVSGFKKNKVLPCNIDADVNVASCNLEEIFCTSPKVATSTTEVSKQRVKNSEVSNAVPKSSRDCYTKRCSDPKFDDVDQRFFAEESYV